MAAANRPPVRKQTSVVQIYDIPVVVSSETIFDVARLAACCAPVPGLAPVVESLQLIYRSVERVSWNKAHCRKLSTRAMQIVFVISDHYDNSRAEQPKLQVTIDKTVAAMKSIDVDVQYWASLGFWRSWYNRHEIDDRLAKHEEALKGLTQSLSLAAVLETHDMVANLQESLRVNPAGSSERKRAEEQLYRLRNNQNGEMTELTPPELACECTRLGTQPEHSGPRNDIWKGRWLDKEYVALIFYKGYKMGTRDENGIRRFDRQIKVWRKLDNPYVLKLHGWCKFDGETYLVSPWLRNGDVCHYLEGDRNRNKKSVDLINEIALGLKYLHNQDLIHGSLKPSNILINDDGRAVLSDFSLAKLATLDAKNTESNPQVNGFRYQAPEVILDEPMGKSSDVYSWAMTSLEIITGNPPYHTITAPGELVKHVVMKHQVPKREDYPNAILDKYPQIWELFERCWSQKPAARPTPAEIIEVLKTVPAE